MRKRGECQSYFSFVLGYQQRKEITSITRRFQTLQELISGIGGFYSSIWVVLSLFFRISYRNLGKRVILQRIFNLGKNQNPNRLERGRGNKTAVERAIEETVLQSKSGKAAAEALVEEYLDIYALTRELMLLRMLMQYLLDPKTQAAAPALLLLQKIIAPKSPPEQSFLEKEPGNISIEGMTEENGSNLPLSKPLIEADIPGNQGLQPDESPHRQPQHDFEESIPEPKIEDELRSQIQRSVQTFYHGQLEQLEHSTKSNLSRSSRNRLTEQRPEAP